MAAELRAILVGGLVAMAGLGGARAYTLEGPSWLSAKTSFAYVFPGSHPTATQAFKSAMSDWNTRTPFKFTPLNRTADPCNMNGVNGVSFSQTACGKAFGSATLAVTLYSYSADKHFIHAGTVFNAQKTFGAYTGPLHAGAFDIRRVAVHELGHALGLGHETQAGVQAIMRPTISDIQHPQPDDVAGARALYP